eukprot:553725-Rhodomonas_salina.2
MCGTELAHGATVSPTPWVVLTERMVLRQLSFARAIANQVAPPIVLRARYAMAGTGLAYVLQTRYAMLVLT